MTTKTHSRRVSILMATVVAITLVIWLWSGQFYPSEDESQPEASDTSELLTVSIAVSEAKTVNREIVANARTEPDRIIELKAETRGVVIEASAERGMLVARGESLARLDLRDRLALLNEAEALIRQRELEFEAATRLQQQQFISDADLAGAEALLVSARAAFERASLDIDRTDIKAPFEALVDDRFVEIGDYVDIGDPIAQLVDSDPLIVVGHINQRDVSALRIGATGYARILDEPRTAGVVRYIAPLADESTRTFRVELAVPNPELKLRVGTSAELVLLGEEMTAHEVAPSQLALADDGTVGVKAVDASNIVRFYPVDRMISTENGLLVTGLPPIVTLITTGQGFVIDGQRVIPVEETPPATRTQNERSY